MGFIEIDVSLLFEYLSDWGPHIPKELQFLNTVDFEQATQLMTLDRSLAHTHLMLLHPLQTANLVDLVDYIVQHGFPGTFLQLSVRACFHEVLVPDLAFEEGSGVYVIANGWHLERGEFVGGLELVAFVGGPDLVLALHGLALSEIAFDKLL